jgi:hypothetical protein
MAGTAYPVNAHSSEPDVNVSLRTAVRYAMTHFGMQA